MGEDEIMSAPHETSIIPLATLNVPAKLAQIRAMEAHANAYAKLGLPVMPGIPNIPQMIRDILKNM